MPRRASSVIGYASDQRKTKRPLPKAEARYTVGFDQKLAQAVKRYAQTTDTSLSKAISSLVVLGLESQELRKQEFFKRLKENLANDDPAQQDQLVDDFRSLILGR